MRQFSAEMLTAVPLASKGYSALAFPLTQHSYCSYAAYPVPTSGDGLDADELSHGPSNAVKILLLDQES